MEIVWQQQVHTRKRNWCVVEGICNFILSVQVSIPSTHLYSLFIKFFLGDSCSDFLSQALFSGKKPVIINNEVASGKEIPISVDRIQ